MVAKLTELHALVDVLPEAELETARRFLETLRRQSDDALVALLRSAPIDDEPISEEEEEGAAEAREEIARGEAASAAEAKRLLLS